MYKILLKEPQMKTNILRKIIREELKNSLKEMSEMKKRKTVQELIANIYMKIMNGQIEAAKRALSNDPELQKMAQRLDDLTNEMADKMMENPEATIEWLMKLKNNKDKF
jgi:glutamyl-tRNA reductase